MNTIQQRGDEMVERYLRLHWRMTNEAATRCAIRSCEDTIEELKEIVAMAPLSISRRITNKKKIIEYLKTKL